MVIMTSKDKNTLCPNCENNFDINFDYCPHCGQKNKEVKLDFKYLINDFLAGSFNIDSKFVVSFKLLITKPAFLSKEFLKGKRTKYLSPLRMYLLVSLVYFTVLTLGDPIIQFGNDDKAAVEDISNYVVFDNKDILSNDSLLKSNQLTEVLNDSTESLAGIELSKLKSLNTKEGRKKFNDSFSEYVSGSMFFVMPLAAFILFIFYGKRRKGYYFESLIFFIHLQTLIFLILAISNLFDWLFSFEWVLNISYLLVLTASIIWLKNFYSFKWLKAIFATLLFVISYLIVILISFVFVAYFSLLLM